MTTSSQHPARQRISTTSADSTVAGPHRRSANSSPGSGPLGSCGGAFHLPCKAYGSQLRRIAAIPHCRPGASLRTDLCTNIVTHQWGNASRPAEPQVDHPQVGQSACTDQDVRSADDSGWLCGWHQRERTVWPVRTVHHERTGKPKPKSETLFSTSGCHLRVLRVAQSPSISLIVVGGKQQC
jgi:hypothetical protein